MGWQQVVGWSALALGVADLAVLNVDVFPALAEQSTLSGDLATDDRVTAQSVIGPASPAAPSSRARTGDGAIDADALRATAGERAGILDSEVAQADRPSSQAPKARHSARSQKGSEPGSVFGGSQQAVLDRLAFSFRAYQLHAGHRRQLRGLVSTLKADVGERVLMVVGHTDNIGTEQNNHALGLLRAEAVADALVELGLARTRLRVLSAGESNPRSRGRSLRDRRKNRRVELFWQGSPR